MKHLKIEYNGAVIWEGDVAELSWTDSERSVTVTGKPKAAASSSSGGLSALFDTFASRSNARPRSITQPAPAPESIDAEEVVAETQDEGEDACQV